MAHRKCTAVDFLCSGRHSGYPWIEALVNLRCAPHSGILAPRARAHDPPHFGGEVVMRAYMHSTRVLNGLAPRLLPPKTAGHGAESVANPVGGLAGRLRGSALSRCPDSGIVAACFVTDRGTLRSSLRILRLNLRLSPFVESLCGKRRDRKCSDDRWSQPSVFGVDIALLS